MEQTRELLNLMNYKKIEENNWSQMIAMNKQAAPFIPADVWTDVQTNIDGIDYATLMQPIYAKYLSQEDAAKALEFYKTPAGTRVLQSMPPMLGESVAAAQQKGRQVGRDAIEKHRPEIEEAQKKYQAEHPQPAGSAGPGAGGATPAQPASPSPAPLQQHPRQHPPPSRNASPLLRCFGPRRELAHCGPKWNRYELGPLLISGRQRFQSTYMSLSRLHVDRS